MHEKIIVAFLGVLCLGTLIGQAILFLQISSSAGPHVSSTQDPIIAEMISKTSESEIYDTVYHLQNFTTRRYNSSGNLEAATYLYNRFRSISGLSVEYQGSYKNIIATLYGTDTASNALYMVGAHYDSISSDPNYAPGATDNGGGVAIVLELARIMSQYKFAHTLKFAFWNDEEDGLHGSGEYAWYAKNNNLNVSLYFNYDSSCYDPNNHFILDIMYNSQSQWVSNMMTELNALYNVNFTLTYNAHTCSSDYAPFWWRGYTAVMTHEETHGPAHSPEDTIDKVSTLYAKKNGQLGMSVLAELAEVQDNKPPTISILSPENKTYSTRDIFLTFTIDEAFTWIGYSLDEQTNQSITGNTSLLSLSDGLHAITVYANDTVGNMGKSNTVYFTVNTNPPTGSIIIADGAAYTNSTSVTLTLSAEDDTSSISQMRFRNEDNTTWSNWEPYVTSKSWTLSSGDGTKTVFVQFASASDATKINLASGGTTADLSLWVDDSEVWKGDSTGLISQPYQDTIILDTKKPTANAGNDTTVNEDSLVTFDASASNDENGIASYIWTFSDEMPQTLTGKNPTYTFATPGTYMITLEVTDPAGNTATGTVIVTVFDVTKPIANAGQDRTVKVGLNVHFDASASTDNVGIVSYEWDFGDGTTGTGITASHVYLTPNAYAVKLTVKDASDNTATHSITVTVEAVLAETPPTWLIGVVTAAITLAVAIVAILYWKKRK